MALLKLNQNGISGNLLRLLRDFLFCRNQRLVLNGQHSSWDNVNAGVPQEVILSRKIKILLHPTLLFNNIPLSSSLFQKHLRLTLNIKLSFSEHIKSITKKISKTMVLLRKFQ